MLLVVEFYQFEKNLDSCSLLLNLLLEANQEFYLYVLTKITRSVGI